MKKFDVAVSIAGGKLFAASVPAPVEGEDLVVMHVDVRYGVRGTPLGAGGRGLRLRRRVKVGPRLRESSP